VLWQENSDLALAALRHPFVRGLADGTLAREAFAGYVAQDAYFLEAFARAYALALAHSPDRAGLDAFADLLAGVRGELALHASYAQRWSIGLTTVEPGAATPIPTSFARRPGTVETCAAMTPCMRLYAYLGQSLAQTTVSDTYADWVRTYADPQFNALPTSNGFDTYVGTPTRRAIYRRAMRLEVAFLAAAYG
jgi:thiaminase/transcriptional activator TenA